MKKIMPIILAATAAALLAGCASKISAPRIEEATYDESGAPVLTWEAVRNVHFYELEVSLDPDFDIRPGTYHYSVKGAARRLDFDMRYYRHYYWRVRAVHWDGSRSDWSVKGNFRPELLTH